MGCEFKERKKCAPDWRLSLSCGHRARTRERNSTPGIEVNLKSYERYGEHKNGTFGTQVVFFGSQKLPKRFDDV